MPEWKAWPGGQFESDLNPRESFSSADFGFQGNVDWDVGQGPVSAAIVETGTTTATNRASIKVHYHTQSATAAEGETVWVQATQGGVTKTKKRTVFSVSWSLKFSGTVHADDNLRFPLITGIDRDKCEFNWDGEHGATRTAAKMEAICSFFPTSINWSARGVTFKYSENDGGAKFVFRLHRRMIRQNVGQSIIANFRRIENNSVEWEYDGNSDDKDTQYPTGTKPDRAFRQDDPGFDAEDYLQKGARVDFREVAEWHDGTAWREISISSEGEWFFNGTSLLPNGAKGGTNNHGAGSAEDIPNARPVANAGSDQTVNSAASVTLDGSGSHDADNDDLTYKWTQTAGGAVTLSDSTAQKPTFTAPNGPATITFELKVTDITTDLHHHKPTNSVSAADNVTITVNAP